VYQHYQPSTPLFCTLNYFFDCTIFEKSPYSTLDGFFILFTFTEGPQVSLSLPLPHALVFLFLFLIVFVATLFLQQRRQLGMREKRLALVTKVLLYLGAVYAIALMYLQSYILYAYHLWYFVLTVLIFASLWLFIGLHLQLHKKTLGNQRRNYRKKHS